MAINKKLEMIYHNGQPDGIRSIRRNLSTMTTCVIPRPLLSEAKCISGINRPGIYYLINESDNNKIAQIYIGQTRNGVTRLDDHNRSKDFWNKAILFLADSKTFTLDMISGLEKFAILKAQESKRYKIENTVVPKYEIDEYDLAAIEEVYDEIQFIMATQGYKMSDAKATIHDADILHTIVARIESLFAKLDEAKQKAQDALDSFEPRKAAILHKAFTGELTAKWRKEHGVGMESWENVSVSEICHSLKYGTAKKSSSEGTVVVIRMGNLQDGEISWDDLAYSDDEEDIEKYKLMLGDVLFNRTNSPALVGKTSIYRGEYPAIYAGYLIKLDYDHSRVIGDYLNYSLNTVSAKEYCNFVKTDGVNQSNINAQKIGAYRFDMPKINEQSEIVRRLDGLLAKEQQAKAAAEAVLDQIDLIKKAILARAFRGELGTNDPAEESAVELVKRIIQKEGAPHANP